MWFLKCDGDGVFDNKRIWLRPGTQFLLGRTRPQQDAPGFFLEHSTVSRKHLLISVADVKPGDSTRLHAKSKLTVTDNSKMGTTVDGSEERLSKHSITLDKNEHTLKLGSFPHLFRIKWVPATFSFTSLRKSAKKRSENPLAEYSAILEPLDIKCNERYYAEYTSHAVAAKRNTAAVLQALVNGRHIVTDAYIQALTAVGEKNCPNEQSLLELDFDANWPRELDYLPPSAKEPNPRPPNSDQFLPNLKRSEMFAKYTFVFHDQGQYDQLMPVVTGGGGKVLLRHVKPGETDISDMVEYVREVAGKKGDSSFRLSQRVGDATQGGIVILRVGNNGAQVPGYYEQLDKALGQQSMEQNEFLDAILDIDASKLKRGIDVEDVATEDAAAPSEQPRYQQDPLQQAVKDSLMAEGEQQSPGSEEAVRDRIRSALESSQPVSRRRTARQRFTQPKYRGFDDFEPADSLPQFQPSSPPRSAAEPSQAASIDPVEAEYPEKSQSQISETQRTRTQQNTRKRRGEPLGEERETTKDVVDGMLQGAAVMKRRKLEEQRLNAASLSESQDAEMGDDQNESLQPIAVETTKRPSRRKGKEIDVRAVVNERRQAEDEARQRDEESLRAAFDGMDVADIRNLAQVEEMDIVRRDAPPRTRDKDSSVPSSDRWDDRWNGRKNFKKFRRQGAANEGGYERQRIRVIVPLEEVQKKANGVGEEYWLESVEETRQKAREKRRDERRMQRQSQVQSRASHTSVPVADVSPSTLRSQSQRSNAGRVRDSMGSAGEDDGGMGDVHEGSNNIEDDDDGGGDDAARFHRRLRISRLEDAETADAEEIFPEEIAGTARDSNIRTAVHEYSTAASKDIRNSVTQKTTQKTTSTQNTVQASAMQTGKRKATKQGAGSAPKKTKANSTSKSAGMNDDEAEESDEEDALRFRRRKR